MAPNVAKLIPSDPEKVMVIRSITPDIKTFSTPFLRFGRVKIGGRGTAVRLGSGTTAVFSPVALTPTVRAEMASLGPTKYLVALDQEHHIFLEDWHKAFPDAKVIAPETLPAYRDKQGYFRIPEGNWKLFEAGASAQGKLSVDEEFDREFDFTYVDGHANKEVVFNHRKSGTLIEGDLLFNLPATEQFSRSGLDPKSGLLSRLFSWLNSTQGEALAQRRLIWYGICENKPAYNREVNRISGWKFDRIIPCHGDVIETGGKGIFDKVMKWHLEAARKGQ
ncbi:hypothetical protein WHR41_05724 [Cladosporium halotolerans]|uniref:Uncharacterized protein n=1 Tax=Cladosporium halotolerans TaxID=1052096 RepID=A0AB34KLF0_9PEZI